MASACQKSVLAMMMAGLTASGASAAPEEQQLEEVLVTARRTLENAQDVPVAVTVLPADRLANYDINSLEKLVATLPDLILTRGNSGSGLDISLRGIDREVAQRLVTAADEVCPYSRATRGNIDVAINLV